MQQLVVLCRTSTWRHGKSSLFYRDHHQSVPKEGNLVAQPAQSAVDAVTQRLDRHWETSPRIADNMRRDVRSESRNSSAQHQWRQRHIIIGAMDVHIESKSMRQVHQRTDWVP